MQPVGGPFPEFHLASVIVLVSLLAAIQASAQVASPVIRDSAGVRIVEYRSRETVRDAPSPFKLESNPWLQLGGLKENLEEEFDFTHPFLAPTRLSDGRIAVTDWASIKFFDSTGRFLGSAGRSGRGPGEFTQLRRVCLLRGDTLLAIDYSDGRLSLWDGQGNLIRAYTRIGYLATDPCFPDGTLLAQRPPPGKRSAITGPQRANFARFKLDGTVITEVGDLPLDEYGPIMRLATVIASTDRIYVADAKSYEVRVKSRSGQLTWILRVLAPPMEITDDRWRSEIDRRIPPDVPPAQRRAQIAREMQLPRPDVFPAYRRVRVDPVHRLWIQSYEKPELWTVFDSVGVLLGNVRLPQFDAGPGVLAAIERNALAILHPDADGARRISFYRFTEIQRRK